MFKRSRRAMRKPIFTSLLAGDAFSLIITGAYMQDYIAVFKVQPLLLSLQIIIINK